MQISSVLLILLLPMCQGYNYLILHPFYSGSHVLTLHSVAGKLIEIGHKVTTVRYADQYGLKLKPLGINHTEIVLYLNNSNGEIPYITIEEKGEFAVPNNLLWSDGQSLANLLRLLQSPWTIIKHYCHQMFNNKDLIKRLTSETFDVTIVDLVHNECGLTLSKKIIKPKGGEMGYWALSLSGGEVEFTNAATPSSHIPAFMSGLGHNMNFFERILNFGVKSLGMCMMYYHTQFTDRIIQQYFKNSESSRQMLADLNGVLINSDNILDYPRLQPENFVNVGGIQIKTKVDPLPEPFHSFIKEAQSGVILFTLGFIFNPTYVPQSTILALLQAFEKLPQRVIVKFNGELDPKLIPSNVLTAPFVPQQDILANPNTILFFTHCGMKGVTEAIYHSVPMVGMPIFIDQIDIRVRMEEKGIGIGIEKSAGTEEIYQAIVKVRDDKTFKENVSKLSKLMKKRRHHPMEDAIWWLQYLAETEGAEHLKLSSRHLNTFQYFSLDVLLFLLLTVLAFINFLCFLWKGKSRKVYKDKNE